MSKHFYWLIVLSIFVLFAKAGNIDKQKTEQLKNSIQSNLSMQDLDKKVSSFTKSEFAEKLQEDTQKSIEKYGKIDNINFKKILGVDDKKDNNTTKNTIFYMYSQSMPFSTIKNLIPQIKKFKEIKPDSQFYIVFNGFPKRSFFEKLRVLYKDSLKGILSVKVHPYIFKYYKLDMVPAYIYIKCGIGKNFRFNQCLKKKSVLVRGDISLDGFFEVLSNNDKKYLKTYNELTKVEQ